MRFLPQRSFVQQTLRALSFLAGSGDSSVVSLVFAEVMCFYVAASVLLILQRLPEDHRLVSALEEELTLSSWADHVTLTSRPWWLRARLGNQVAPRPMFHFGTCVWACHTPGRGLRTQPQQRWLPSTLDSGRTFPQEVERGMGGQLEMGFFNRWFNGLFFLSAVLTVASLYLSHSGKRRAAREATAFHVM